MRVVESEAELFEFRLIEFEDLVVGEVAVVFFGEVVVDEFVQFVTRLASFFARQLLFFFRARTGSPGAHRLHDRASPGGVSLADRDPLRRVLRRRRGLPEEWQAIVEANVAVWQRLDGEERALLRERCDGLLRHKYWEASTGFALTDEIRVTVAALAALLVMRLDLREYAEVRAIVVYPSAMQSRGEYAGPIAGTVSDGIVPVVGQAHDRRGPVLLAWDDVLAAARAPGTGHNVVFHEFAHKLDMADNLLDGTPPLRQRGEVARWVEVCTEAFQALRAGVDRPPLQPYGATNPSEFFAVATEAFFDVPIELQRNEPDLYDVIRGYYRQDPARRMSS